MPLIAPVFSYSTGLLNCTLVTITIILILHGRCGLRRHASRMRGQEPAESRNQFGWIKRFTEKITGAHREGTDDVSLHATAG